MPATIIISVLLLGIVFAIVVSMIRSHKKGRPSCGCGCSGCPSAGKCRSQEPHS